MKYILALLTVTLFLACSQKNDYAELVQKDKGDERDGWDWIVIGDSEGEFKAQAIAELIKRDAWRVEWFRSSVSFHKRNLAPKTRVLGMKSILLIGDAATVIRDFHEQPRDLVILFPTGEPPSSKDYRRPWRVALILEAKTRDGSSKRWVGWATEINAKVIELDRTQVASEATWIQITSKMSAQDLIRSDR